jgi:hypothetical protein
VAASGAAEALTHELTRQLKQHPRVSLLLLPKLEVIDGDDWISLYWLDRVEDAARDTVVRVRDYEGQHPDAAAERIISTLISSA